RAAANAPKMRPRGTSSPRSEEPAVKPDLQSSASPPATASASSTSGASVSETSAAVAADIAAPVGSGGVSASISVWPMEPKTFERKNLFEQSGEEYPWADKSDYAFGSATPILSELLPTTEAGKQALTKSLRSAGYYS